MLTLWPEPDNVPLIYVDDGWPFSQVTDSFTWCRKGAWRFPRLPPPEQVPSNWAGAGMLWVILLTLICTENYTLKKTYFTYLISNLTSTEGNWGTGGRKDARTLESHRTEFRCSSASQLSELGQAVQCLWFCTKRVWRFLVLFDCRDAKRHHQGQRLTLTPRY